jgi:MFS family permease
VVERPATAETERARWRAFAVAVSVAALTILDLSKVNVGLPSIEDSLGAGSSDLQLIVAGYALAFGLSLVPSGRLGDISAPTPRRACSARSPPPSRRS